MELNTHQNASFSRDLRPVGSTGRAISRLPTSSRILIGGVGALTPVLLNLLVVDVHTVFVKLTIVVFASYVLKVVIMFYLGGLMAWLHRREKDPLKLFEIGIIAPALLTAMMNGLNAEKHRELPPAAETARLRVGLAALLPPVAHAQQAERRVYSFSQPPPESLGEQFLRGFFGRTSRGLWFVCLRGFHSTPEQAFRVGSTLLTARGVRARVYGPGGPGPGFVLVVGDWLDEEAAARMVHSARGRGLEAYLWTPGRR